MPPPPATLRGAWKIKQRLRREAGLPEYLPPEYASEGSGDESVRSDSRPQQYKKRQKTAKPKREELVQGAEAARRSGIQVVLPHFSTFRSAAFDTHEELLEYFQEYCATHNVAYRVRQSTTRDFRNNELVKLAAKADANKKREEKKTAQKSASKKTKEPRLNDTVADKGGTGEESSVGAPLTGADKKEDKGEASSVDATLQPLPPSMTYFNRVYECVHQGHQAPRAKGERFHALKRYTECEARITARAEYDSNKWRVVIENENTTHNHLCTEPIFYSYITSSKIDDVALFGEVASHIDVDGNPRIIRDRASAKMSAPFTRRQFSNFKHYQLGTVKAGENLEELVRKFRSATGNWCEVLREEGSSLVRGLVFQTAAQRAQFQQYGDSLVLDWTHNTNNLGYHLGSLLATSATGKGVPVLDFLCLSQGTATLTSVLEHFVNYNPGAVGKVRSFVIDKDLAEWAAIRAVFPRSAVVLCQFHVVKWFKGCMSNTDYNIEPVDRKATLNILRSMVYAPSKNEFRRRKGLLHRVLDKEGHTPFHAYMKRRWYSMKKQWTNYKRGNVFSAGNTTSNRLESHWRHLKAGLRQRRRIDSCVQAIMMRGRAVLSRERDEIIEHQGKTRVLQGVHKFVHALLRCLSSSRVTLVRRQWEKYSSHPDWYQGCIAKSIADDSPTFMVSLVTQPGVEYEVSCPATSKWSCTCHFATTHGLPCRHQFYVGLKHQSLPEFPVSALSSRWKMGVAATLVDELEATIDHLATVRVPVPGVDIPQDCPPSTSTAGRKESKMMMPLRPKTISHVRLRPNESSEALVLDALQKRNHIRGQLERVMLPMMELSTPRFWAFSEKLEAILTEFTASLAPSPPVAAAVVSSTAYDDDVDTPTGPQPAPTIPESVSAQPTKGGSLQLGGTPDDGEHLDPAPAPSSPESASTQPTEGGSLQLGGASDDGESLDPAVLADLLYGEELEREGDGAATYNPAEEDELDNDEDEDADEEDFIDIGDVVAQHEALLYDQLDLCSLLDTASSSLQSTGPAVFHGFVFDSPQINSVDAPRFPSLPEDEATSQLDSLMVDSDRDDDSPSVSSVLGRYVEAVAGAVVASTYTPVGTQVVMSQQLSLSSRAVTASNPGIALAAVASVVLPDDNDKTTGDMKSVKRKAADDGESPTEDCASVTKAPRVDDGLLISKNLPAARRGTPKQNKQLAGSRDRVAAIVTRSECPVPVAEFVSILQFSNLAEFDELVTGYPVLYTDSFFETRGVKIRCTPGPVPTLNFFIPPTVEERIRSALNDAKAAEGMSLLVDAGLNIASPTADGCNNPPFAARIEGMAQELDEDGLVALTAASSARLLHARYRSDLDWVQSHRKWEKARYAAPLPFLDTYAAECGGGASSFDVLGVEEMREKIVVTLGGYSLRTTLAVPVLSPAAGDVPVSRTPCVPLPEVLGRLRDNEWLNDTIVNFTLHLLANEYADVTVVDSLTRKHPVAPPAFLTLQRLVVFPVNFVKEHWCIICVEFDWKKQVATAYAYDPLGKGKYDEGLEEAWASWCYPLLNNWLKRDQRRVLSVPNSPEITELPCISFHFAVVGTPKQLDGYSCGVYCIAQALCYMKDDFAMHEFASYSPSRLQVMRLRLLYTICTKATPRIDEDARSTAMVTKKAFRAYAAAVGQASVPSVPRRASRSKPRSGK